MGTITTIDELRMMAQGEVVKFPSYQSGQDIYVRMKRPSLLKLIEKGKIPNALLTAANTLFAGDVGQGLEQDEGMLKEILSVIDILAEASFVEPSWKDIIEAGIELTDEQYMFIFNYTQKGVNALTPIGEKPTDPSDNLNVGEVPL